jgi:hypothetical protein
MSFAGLRFPVNRRRACSGDDFAATFGFWEQILPAAKRYRR